MTTSDILAKVTTAAIRYQRAADRAQSAKDARDAMIHRAVGDARYEDVATAARLTKDRVNQIVREQRRKQA